MIEIRGLSFRYAGESRDALRNIDMTVEDGDFIGVDRAEIPRRIDEALDDVGIAPLRHRAIDSLSGGQKQKVAIAAILALRPKILVLDFAHRVLVLCEGALLLDGETRAVFRNEAVLRQASVLPPQITRLSLRLADCLPPADTAEEMEAAVRAARERGVPA